MKLFASFAALTIFAAPVYSASVSPEFVEGMDICRRLSGKVYSHERDYDEGKRAADLLNAFEASGKMIDGVSWDYYKQHFMQTRKDFKMAVVIVTQEIGLEKMAGCWMTSLAPLAKEAWSSQHSGFTEHLNAGLKKLFFSVPER